MSQARAWTGTGWMLLGALGVLGILGAQEPADSFLQILCIS